MVLCTSTKPFFYLYINWREGCRMMKCGAKWLRYPSWQQVVVFPVTSTEGRSFEISVASLLIYILRSDKFQKLAGLKMYLPWKWSVWSNICTQEAAWFSVLISESANAIQVRKWLWICFRSGLSSNFRNPKNIPESECFIPCCCCHCATIRTL